MRLWEALKRLKQGKVARLEAWFSGAGDIGELVLLEAFDRDGNRLELPKEMEKAGEKLAWAGLGLVPFGFDDAGGRGRVAVDLVQDRVDTSFCFLEEVERGLEGEVALEELDGKAQEAIRRALSLAPEGFAARMEMNDPWNLWRMEAPGKEPGPKAPEDLALALCEAVYKAMEKGGVEQWISWGGEVRVAPEGRLSVKLRWTADEEGEREEAAASLLDMLLEELAKEPV